MTEVLQLLGFPEPSLAVQVTGAAPSENVPEPGVHPTDATLQLSVAVAVTVALAPFGLVHSSVCGAGHVMLGGVVSRTVTVAVHIAVWPPGSLAVSVTPVTPRLYGPGGDWVSVTGSPSGS